MRKDSHDEPNRNIAAICQKCVSYYSEAHRMHTEEAQRIEDERKEYDGIEK